MITLEPYQDVAAGWLCRRKRGLVQSAAGSGKTIIAAAALCRVVMAKPRDRKVRVGWMANTREQIDPQAVNAVAAFPEMHPFIDIKYACAAAETDWRDRDVLIVDECHHCATAATWQAQAQSCTGARWGFTATPGDDIGQLALLRLIFGEMHVVPREQTQKRLAKGRVIVLDDTDPVGPAIDAFIQSEMHRRGRWYRFKDRQAQNKVISNKQSTPEMIAQANAIIKGIDGELYAMCSWAACIEIGIIPNVARNAAAIRTAMNHWDESVLMLVNQIDHGQALAEKIPGAMLCYSKMGMKKRRAALDAFRERSCHCIIATSLADEGLDLPMANVLVMVSAGRSKRLTEQRSGRVLRAFAGKTEGLIYDFSDLAHPLMAKHSRVRMDVYRALGYDVPQRNLPGMCAAPQRMA